MCIVRAWLIFNVIYISAPGMFLLLFFWPFWLSCISSFRDWSFIWALRFVSLFFVHLFCTMTNLFWLFLFFVLNFIADSLLRVSVCIRIIPKYILSLCSRRVIERNLMGFENGMIGRHCEPVSGQNRNVHYWGCNHIDKLTMIIIKHLP